MLALDGNHAGDIPGRWPIVNFPGLKIEMRISGLALTRNNFAETRLRGSH
jgi:hypothetical protein